MKKQIIILAFLFFNFLFSLGQSRFVKTTKPCNKELLLKTPGEWLPLGQDFNSKVSKQEQQEFLKRLSIIQNMVYNIYPSPMAFDAGQFFFTYDNNFATHLKIESSANGPRYSYVNGTSIIHFGYGVKFCAYNCGREPNEIMLGRGCEAGTAIAVHINSLDPFFTPITDNMYKEDMIIEGRPIKMMPVLREKKWKGYDIYSPESGSSVELILIHREGILPYIPVTRKQYLDRSIACLQRFYDNGIKAGDEIIKQYDEIIPTLTDKKQKEDIIKQKEEYLKQKEGSIKEWQKQKDDVIKYYKDEVNATTSAGLLDSPAIITGIMANVLTQYPIFTTQADGGRLLVTENPAYFKKDLPKYLPQLIIYRMWNCNNGPDPSINPYKFYKEDFPIEKLRAMIFMKNNKNILLLAVLSFLSISFTGKPIHKVDLAEYEVRFMFTGYIPFSGGVENCLVNEKGKVILSGILKGNENMGKEVPVLYTGILQISINIDICSVKREANGEDKFCTITVTGAGPVNTELEMDPAAGYGYIKIKYEPSLGKFVRSVNGNCHQAQMTGEEKMIPNETVAAIFNGRELPMLTERTLRKKLYPAVKSAEGITEVEVIRKLR